MKISKIKIKNIIGIEELETDVKGNLLLEGTNGVGKTSIIDAIRVAVSNSANREVIVRQGKKEGEIYLELDDGLKIERKKRENKSDYKKITKDEQEVAKPETYLKNLFTELQLNPAQFINYTDKEKNRILLNMIEFDWNLAWIEKQFGEIPKDVDYDQHILEVLNDIQSDKGYYYNKRQDINRAIREKRAVIRDIMEEIPENYSAEKWRNFSLMEIYNEVTKMEGKNHYKQKVENNIEKISHKMSQLKADVSEEIQRIYKQASEQEKELDKTIERLEKQLALAKQQRENVKDKADTIVKSKQQELHTKLKELEQDKKDQEKELKNIKTYSDEEIEKKKIEGDYAEKMRGHLNEYDRALRIEGEIEDLDVETQELTRKIELARELPGEILKTAQIPIKELSVEDGKPLINGLPVNNLSEGELLDLCVDVTIQKPEGLRLILLDSIPNDLSEDNQKRLFKKLKEHDIQFVATKTTNDRELKIIEL
jgi:exonuclease SbcC